MKRHWYATPYALWMVIFTIVPLLFVVYYAFTAKDGSFSLDNFGKFFQATTFPIVLDSFRLALECTALCLVLGYPAAYFMASKDFSNNRVLVVLILLPMWMNFLLRTYAMMNLLESTGLISSLLVKLGMKPLSIIGTESAVLLGMVYNYLPFMILPIYTVLKKMDQRVIEAAEDLGANPARVFTRVVFPLSLPGVLSGITMVFMPAVTTFAISRMLSNGNVRLIGDLIEEYFITFPSRNVGSALSLVLMVFIVISIGLLRRADPKGEGAGLW